MDRNSLIRVVLFVLVWVNSFLASKGLKTIPVLDDSQVAGIITFAVTAYGVIKHEFLTKKKVVAVAPVKVEQVTPKVEAKPEPVVVPVTPSNQPVSPTPVAQPVQPTVTQDNQTK